MKLSYVLKLVAIPLVGFSELSLVLEGSVTLLVIIGKVETHACSWLISLYLIVHILLAYGSCPSFDLPHCYQIFDKHQGRSGCKRTEGSKRMLHNGYPCEPKMKPYNNGRTESTPKVVRVFNS